MNQFDIEMTDKELRGFLKTWGWLIKKDGDEYEVYPKGERGTMSYFTTDKQDALATAKREATAMFADRISFITYEDGKVQDALLQWFDHARADWKTALASAWYTGNYGRLVNTSTAATLQRLRNRDANIINII